MYTLLSPAKTLDFNQDYKVPQETNHAFPNESLSLIKTLKNKPQKDIKSMMGISTDLVKLNVERYKSYDPAFPDDLCKPAILAFKGEVYIGLQAEDFNEKDLMFAQKNIRILSGLYGILKPLDKIQAYRLEMGTSLKTRRGKNLYNYWGDSITKWINEELKEAGADQIVNLASNEYYKVVNKKKLQATVLDIDFREDRDGKLQFISFTAKKARGLMARYIVKNRITNLEDLKGFDYEGYHYEDSQSSENAWMFVKF